MMAYSVFRNLRITSASLLRFEIGKATSGSVRNSFVRSLWCLCRKPEENQSFTRFATEQASALNKFHPLCRRVHTKGDQELIEFLVEEIAAETKNQKLPTLPKIEGFDIKTEGSLVTMTKKFKDETIVVKFNVNHTVDTDVNMEDVQEPEKQPEMDLLKSKPSFTVEISRDGNTVGFSCSYSNYEDNPDEPNDPQEYRDIFEIEEVVFHKGEWKDNTYSVSGEIIDGYLYDLLMNYLEERGISTEFADQLSRFSTSYEHKAYISLLENMKAFISGDVPKVVDKKVSSVQK